jgi:DNA-binding PadR family transcriptional regulator
MPRKTMTLPETIAVLRVLANCGDKSLCGYEIAKLLERPRGPVYRTLNKLEAAQLLFSEWDPKWNKKEARRKLYSPTMAGLRFYEQHMALVNHIVMKRS